MSTRSSITTAGYTKYGRGIDITTTFGAAQVKNCSYTNFQERFQHKQFFSQLLYDQSNAGNSSPTDNAGTYYLRSGIPIVDRSSVLVGQVQQRLDYAGTKIVFGGEYNATRPQTDGTIDGRNEAHDNINEYGGYVQTTTPLTSKLDFLASVRGDGNSALQGAQFSPRAALVFKITPNQNVRLTFNRSFNSPASFEFFLDQYSGTTPAPGMPVQILGNPPKEGWTFARGGACATGAGGGLCMRSPYIPNTVVPASAASAYPGFIQALPAIVQGLSLSQIGSEANRTQLLQALVGLAPILNGLRPTDAQVGTNLADLGAPGMPTVTSADDIGALKAAFTNSWEAGYKGILGKRVSLSADFWWQRRPADPTSQLVNPGVLFNGPQLQAYLNGAINQGLTAGGVPAATAAGEAALASAAITQVMAAIPVGATAFTSPLYNQPYLVFTYKPATGFVNVQGIDVAADFTLSDEWTLATTYTNMNKNVFPNAPGNSPANPLAANAPKHRATAAFRYENAPHAYSVELRGRYSDAFPVNSGVFNSYGIGPTGTVPYPSVPVNALLDLNMSWKLPIANAPRLSLTGTNILDNKVQTFVGVPKIGRLVVTQLQYTF